MFNYKATIEYCDKIQKTTNKKQTIQGIRTNRSLLFTTVNSNYLFLSATQLRSMTGGTGGDLFGGWLKGCSVLW